MLIHYKSIVPESGEKDEYAQEVSNDPCCQKMKSAYANDAIVLGDNKYGPTKPVLSIRHTYTSWGDTEHDYYAINFCPFCGGKVMFVCTHRLKQVTRTETEMRTVPVVVKKTIEEVPID